MNLLSKISLDQF